MPIQFTPEMALGIFHAWMAIKRELAAQRDNPDADFTDQDALAMLKSRVDEGLHLIAEWKARPTTPGS